MIYMHKDKSMTHRLDSKKDGFPIPLRNYKLILIGFGIVILGFILMMGKGAESLDTFNYDIFSLRRITFEPLVVLLGFGFIFWAIMRKPKAEDKDGMA